MIHPVSVAGLCSMKWLGCTAMYICPREFEFIGIVLMLLLIFRPRLIINYYQRNEWLFEDIFFSAMYMYVQCSYCTWWYNWKAYYMYSMCNSCTRQHASFLSISQLRDCFACLAAGSALRDQKMCVTKLQLRYKNYWLQTLVSLDKYSVVVEEFFGFICTLFIFN